MSEDIAHYRCETISRPRLILALLIGLAVAVSVALLASELGVEYSVLFYFPKALGFALGSVVSICFLWAMRVSEFSLGRDGLRAVHSKALSFWGLKRTYAFSDISSVVLTYRSDIDVHGLKIYLRNGRTVVIPSEPHRERTPSWRAFARAVIGEASRRSIPVFDVELLDR